LTHQSSAGLTPGTLAADDYIDSANRYAWKVCIINHTASQTYIRALIDQGYVQ
jgi:hypothetical protein